MSHATNFFFDKVVKLVGGGSVINEATLSIFFFFNITPKKIIPIVTKLFNNVSTLVFWYLLVCPGDLAPTAYIRQARTNMCQNRRQKEEDKYFKKVRN